MFQIKKVIKFNFKINGIPFIFELTFANFLLVKKKLTNAKKKRIVFLQ